MIQLIKGDCLVEMKNIPDRSVDMILCDLPYGTTKNKKDKRIPMAPLWNEYNRIIKPHGVITLFAQGLFYVDLINSNRKMFRYDLVWDKKLTSGFLNAKRMPLRRHEQIAVFYKKIPTYNPQFVNGKPLHSKGIAFKNKEHKNQNYGNFKQLDDNRKGSTDKYPTSILEFQKPHPSKAKHRTEKPLSIILELIRTYTNIGDTVVDNCAGSGVTGEGCVLTGRNFIGIEMDEFYFNIAQDRINKAMSDHAE
jgi:site-specific DNA-methyltransferase (adenine-specific)